MFLTSYPLEFGTPEESSNGQLVVDEILLRSKQGTLKSDHSIVMIGSLVEMTL